MSDPTAVLEHTLAEPVTRVSALTVKNVLKSDLNDPKSYVYTLKDPRFLELAKASEETDGAAIADQAGMLGLSADQFNRAQIQALAFAETMEL